jgi:hypothetical protein
MICRRMSRINSAMMDDDAAGTVRKVDVAIGREYAEDKMTDNMRQTKDALTSGCCPPEWKKVRPLSHSCFVCHSLF